MHRYAQTVAEWDIAVSVFVGENYRSVELLSIRPTPTSDTELEHAIIRFGGRLRWVGVAGIVNGETQFILDVPPSHAEGRLRLSAALAEHCNAIRQIEIAKLERMYMLPDTRPYLN